MFRIFRRRIENLVAASGQFGAVAARLEDIRGATDELTRRIPANGDPFVQGELIPPRDLFSYSDRVVELCCRNRLHHAYMGDGLVVSRYLGRFLIWLDQRDRSLAAHVVMDGYWEMALTRFFAKTVEEGFTVFDVGANFGYYSVLLADLVGPDGELVAFEPNPSVHPCLEKSLEMNGFGGRSKVRPLALSDQVGVAKFLVPEGEPKNGSLFLNLDKVRQTTFDVELAPLDQFVNDFQRVDVMKVDAEGAEMGIVLGGLKFLDRFNPLTILEYNAGRSSPFGGGREFARLIAEEFESIHELSDGGDLIPVARDGIYREGEGHDRLLVLRKRGTLEAELAKIQR